MELDGLLQFVPLGSPLSLVVGPLGAGGGVASNIIDLAGAGVGNAPPNIIGNRSVFGTDLGIGRQKTQLLCTTGTAFATANNAAINIQFQGAVDSGVGGGYQPGTWITLVETGYITAANLGAGKTVARFDYPPSFPFGPLPRFLRLFFQLLTNTNFTAGTIAFAMPTTVRDDVNFGARNYNLA
jgi:hypothetical protein